MGLPSNSSIRYRKALDLITSYMRHRMASMGFTIPRRVASMASLAKSTVMY
ncbi:unnamed protein product, partial [Oppiella nova]